MNSAGMVLTVLLGALVHDDNPLELAICSLCNIFAFHLQWHFPVENLRSQCEVLQENSSHSARSQKGIDLDYEELYLVWLFK